MKALKLNVLALLVLGLASTAQAQSNEITMTKSQIINASADDVWNRLRKLDGLEQIIPNFLEDSWVIGDATPGVGAKRSCTAPGTPRGEASYTEQVVEFDDDKRYYSYAILEGIPAKNMVNSFRVIDLGYKKCMVVWESNGGQFQDNPNMSKEQFVGFLNSASDAIMAGLYRLHNDKG